MNRQKIVAGNWKMNLSLQEGTALAKSIAIGSRDLEVTAILCTPYIHLNAVYDIIYSENNMFLGAQNCHHESFGAYTGEISLYMLKSVGCKYVILGHSERRMYNHEDNTLLALKVKAVLKAGLTPIFCCGENLEQRESGVHYEFVVSQLKASLFDKLEAKEFSKLVIAYEPIWAIGTGVTATSAQAQEMHKKLREAIATRYGKAVANHTSILYGGSCKPGNAEEIFAQPDVDGGLIGGAALKAEDFLAIINSF